MGALWVETTTGYVRAEAVTSVVVINDRRRSVWRLVATVAGGSEGTWDGETGGDVRPARAELARGSGDRALADHLPGEVARALVRHREAEGAVVLMHTDVGDPSRGFNVEFEDWSDWGDAS